MSHPIEDFHKYIQPGKRVHLVGIGGVSMCAPGRGAPRHGHGHGAPAPTCPDSATVQHLRSLGMPVAVGHSGGEPEGLPRWSSAPPPPTTTTPRSPAPTPGASPSTSAPRPGAPSCGATRNALCVSGTHGKTTTTSMCHPHRHGRPGRPHGDDRRHPAPAPRRPPGGHAATPSSWRAASTATPSSPSSPPWR